MQPCLQVCGHKWADLSEYDWGVAVLNDSHYGWSCIDSVLRLSLYVFIFIYRQLPHYIRMTKTLSQYETFLSANNFRAAFLNHFHCAGVNLKKYAHLCFHFFINVIV